MSKTPLIAALMLVGIAGAAEAGGQQASFGVGAEYLLSGAGGASFNYDGGAFHAGGFLGFADEGDNSDSVFQVGGRFFYHLHSTAMSDFGVGGNMGVVSFTDMNNDRASAIFVEPGIQIRLFLASNVALSATTGLIIGVGDAEGVAVTGGVVGGNGLGILGGLGGLGLALGGGIGLHYYFF
jgi:hypothetical protein